MIALCGIYLVVKVSKLTKIVKRISGANVTNLFQACYSVPDNRPVAIIKIWNPETEKRKVPKLFCWNYFWETF